MSTIVDYFREIELGFILSNNIEMHFTNYIISIRNVKNRNMISQASFSYSHHQMGRYGQVFTVKTSLSVNIPYINMKYENALA